MPLRRSSPPVSNAIPRLSLGLSHQTWQTPYEPFTPNKSEQRSPPTYYRGCWHVVSRGFLSGYRQNSSPVTVVYNPKAFIPHAALLRQAFAHRGRFSTAASRRSLGSVSVPVWLAILSDQLPVIVLVSRYLTNKHNGTRAYPQAINLYMTSHASGQTHSVLAPLSRCYSQLGGKLLTRYSPFRH